MFTGIINEVGRVRNIKRTAKDITLTLEAKEVTSNVKLGDSIAVNGVCLTVVEFSKDHFSADVMHESLEKTTLAKLRPSSKVNLEHALRASESFDGHFVTGHVDGVGKIVSIKKDGNSKRYEIEYGPEIEPVIVKKGSITVDGISLTVVDTTKRRFLVAIIPHTLEKTTLKDKRVGDLVNLEFDMIGKYIKNYLDRG